MPRKREPTVRAGRERLVRAAWVVALSILLTTVSVAYATMSDSASVATTVSTATLAPPSDLVVTQSCTPPTTIVLRGATSATGDDSLTLPLPGGTATGDVLIAQVANRYGAHGGITAPAGWTLLDRRTSGSQVTSAVYWKVATGTEPAAVTFDLLDSAKVQMVGGMVGYRGVSSATPINAWGTSTGTGGTTTVPSVTTTAPGTMLVHAVTKRQEAMPAPGGTTQRWRLISGNGTATEGATGSDAFFAGPGTTPAATTSTGFTAEWVAHTVALQPVPGTAMASATWTATPSTWATGYVAERSAGGVVQASAAIDPASTTSATDGPLVDGVTYTYRLWTYRGSWTSPAVSVTFRPDCP